MNRMQLLLSTQNVKFCPLIKCFNKTKCYKSNNNAKCNISLTLKSDKNIVSMQNVSDCDLENTIHFSDLSGAITLVQIDV